MGRLRSALLALVLAISASVVLAQQAGTTVNYAQWEKDAATAEEVIAAGRASTKAMEDMRARIANWRGQFDTARSANDAQIDTVRGQLKALGTPPADGAVEAPGTASRRIALNEQLSRLQAPGLAAVEAFSRAEGLIRQIDTLISDRQADALLKLMPSPANPLNWPSAVAVLTQGGKTLAGEVAGAWDNPVRRLSMRNNLPLIGIYLALAFFLMWRGPAFMERFADRLMKNATMRGRGIVSSLVSLGQILVPAGGMELLVRAILASGMTGPRLEALLSALPWAALTFFSARWLAHWLFPDQHRVEALGLTDRPAEARFHVRMIGLMLALEGLRQAFTTDVRPPLSQAAQSVWLAPVACIVAIFVLRLGLLLRRAGRNETVVVGEARAFRNRVIKAGGTLMAIVALIAPILALIGYVAAANALIWPMALSAALIGTIILLQRFLTDVYIEVTRSGDEGREALIPVLTLYLLIALAVPAFLILWGVRPALLTDAWTRFNAGFNLGGAQVSPVAVATLFAVFALGYMVTRLVQGAMRSSLLPRTRLDKGAQNAMVAGTGYLGLLLSGLVAVNAAGIDLSSLAIVAGALSVGIGFGLQNIVQNFISGIILLIERPISEGDLVEVGDKIGNVTAISVRSTRILTGDQTEVIVPNAQFISGVVTNWTRDSLRGRAVVPVTVAMGSDTRAVAAILHDVVEEEPLVLIDPAPAVCLTGVGPQGINFEIRAILSDLNLKADVVTEMWHKILDRFHRAGIEMPFGYQTVRLSRPEAAPGNGDAGGTGLPEPLTGPVEPSRIQNNPALDPDERGEGR